MSIWASYYSIKHFFFKHNAQHSLKHKEKQYHEREPAVIKIIKIVIGIIRRSSTPLTIFEEKKSKLQKFQQEAANYKKWLRGFEKEIYWNLRTENFTNKIKNLMGIQQHIGQLKRVNWKQVRRHPPECKMQAAKTVENMEENIKDREFHEKF